MRRRIAVGDRQEVDWGVGLMEDYKGEELVGMIGMSTLGVFVFVVTVNVMKTMRG
jgi:hypothetical protein